MTQKGQAQRINERARALWSADGGKPGSDEEYWLLAEEMIRAEDDADAYRSRAAASATAPP